jgi:hypothetical protein
MPRNDVCSTEAKHTRQYRNADDSAKSCDCLRVEVQRKDVVDVSPGDDIPEHCNASDQS